MADEGGQAEVSEKPYILPALVFTLYALSLFTSEHQGSLSLSAYAEFSLLLAMG